MLIVIKAHETAYITDNSFGAVTERSNGRMLAKGEKIIVGDTVYKVVKKDQDYNALCSEVGPAVAYGNPKASPPVSM